MLASFGQKDAATTTVIQGPKNPGHPFADIGQKCKHQRYAEQRIKNYEYFAAVCVRGHVTVTWMKFIKKCYVTTT
uniref:Uncharacterized protein n=1 Tax=Romanomermis culicivorax TaxID=13658 RepID=A0A915INX9_ROMCU